MPFNAPALPHCITFNKDAISQLINNTGCVAVRMYPAINSNGQLTLVVVGVSETGENIIELADTMFTLDFEKGSKPLKNEKAQKKTFKYNLGFKNFNKNPHLVTSNSFPDAKRTTINRMRPLPQFSCNSL